MTLVIAFLVGVLAHLALRAAGVWWVLGAAQPLLLVAVSAARRYTSVGAAWWGLAAGLASDVLSDRIVGPGGIAGALAAAVVAAIIRSFELAGPLLWITGALIASSIFEASRWAIMASVSATVDHGWLGTIATVATTATLALLVASVERAFAWWQSPDRRRRRVLKQL